MIGKRSGASGVAGPSNPRLQRTRAARSPLSRQPLGASVAPFPHIATAPSLLSHALLATYLGACSRKERPK